jgi:hypothetical protein
MSGAEAAAQAPGWSMKFGKAKDRAPRDKQGNPTIVIDVESLTIIAADEEHAPAKKQKGYVNFFATAPCTLYLSDSTVLKVGKTELLRAGNNHLDVQVEAGYTTYSLEPLSTARTDPRIVIP